MIRAALAGTLALIVVSAAFARPPALGPGVMLVAAETLRDSNFERTVVLLLAHDTTGSIGLVVNRPTAITVEEVLPSTAGTDFGASSIQLGGPVERERVFVLFRGLAVTGAAELLFGDVRVTTDPGALEELAAAEDPADTVRAYAGYAGWAAGQLPSELARGDWLVREGDVEAIFSSKPADEWKRLFDGAAGVWVRLERGGRAGLAQSLSRSAASTATRPSPSSAARMAMGRQQTWQSSTTSWSPALGSSGTSSVLQQ